MSGGPHEGWLQGTSVKGRCAAVLMLLLGLALAQSVAVIAAIFAAVGCTAILSYLNFRGAATTAVIPAVVFGFPAVGAGLLAYDGAVGNFMLIPMRIECAVTIALLATESIGLIPLSHAFGRGKAGLTWLTAIQQTRAMAEHVQDLVLAQRARMVVPQSAAIRRKQIGAQAGAFLSKCLGSAETKSMGLESRIGCGRVKKHAPAEQWRPGDVLLCLAGIAAVIGGYLW